MFGMDFLDTVVLLGIFCVTFIASAIVFIIVAAFVDAIIHKGKLDEGYLTNLDSKQDKIAVLVLFTLSLSSSISVCAKLYFDVYMK